MALVRPLRGIRYDPRRVDLGRVLAPPYDVISPAEREALCARDPHNVVRVDAGLARPDDRPGLDDPYTRARRTLDAWTAEGVLLTERALALYVADHTFTGETGGRMTRRGLYARVRALPWERSDVRPHEHTLRGPKEDRLALMRATATQTSAVLVLWAGATGLDEVLGAATARPADATAAVQGERGAEEHSLWVVLDAPLIASAVEALAAATLYMADGHHRFETAAAYAAERARAESAAAVGAGTAGGHPDGPDGADHSWTLVHLVDAEDPALELLPTHRLVRAAPGVPGRLDEVLGRLDRRFVVERTADLAAAVEAARALRGRRHAVALAAADGAALVHAPHAAGERSPRARLDVSVVEDAVLLQACGLDAERIASGALAYTRSVEDAAAAVRAGEAALAVCVNGCSTAEMMAVSDAGEQMPQKSTYFTPKVPTGLVLSPL